MDGKHRGGKQGVRGKYQRKTGNLILESQGGRKRGLLSTPRSAMPLRDYRKFLSVAGFLDVFFGSFFLKAPFCPQKGHSKR